MSLDLQKNKKTESSLSQLKKAETLSDLSKIVGFKPKNLSYILYIMPKKEKKYHTFKIPKKNGGERCIQAPNPKLKNLQKRIKNVLYNCCKELENSQTNKKRKNLSHGFKKKYSIHTNANIHKNKRYVLNFDIKDFFPTINFGRVRGYFIKNKDFNLNEKVATLIAQIACHDNQLPQGSPCSPIISNLIAHLLDVQLVKVAKKYKLSYSRYADDITFSTNQKVFPKEIAYQNPDNPEDWKLNDIIDKTIESCGFKVHPDKTRMRYQDCRQVVTGLVVNKKVNVRSEYYKRARAMTHSLFTKGEYTIPGKSSPVDIEDSPPQTEKDRKIKSPKRLEGILNHILYTRNRSDQRKIKELENCISLSKKNTRNLSELKELKNRKQKLEKKLKEKTIWRLYKDLLFFKNFIVSTKPVIITEGLTDRIYIKLSLKKFIDDYPSLITKTQDKINYKLCLLDRSKDQVKNILQLSGGKNNGEGTGSLPRFLGEYRKNLEKYPAWEILKQPIILLTDNDEGVKNISKTIKEQYEKAISTEQDKEFIHIHKNLYLIKTPHIGEKENTCIEDLFDQNWLNKIELNGKKFSKEKKYDKQKFYGKVDLAKKVIPKNFSSVDFDNFRLLLDRFVKVIKDYESKKARGV